MQPINGPLEFVQGLHRADVGSRAPVALTGDGAPPPASTSPCTHLPSFPTTLSSPA